jgi:hypothetical protein
MTGPEINYDTQTNLEYDTDVDNTESTHNRLQQREENSKRDKRIKEELIWLHHCRPEENRK